VQTAEKDIGGNGSRLQHVQQRLALSVEVALRLATLVSATPPPDGKEPHD
jgi:hypothetical protein